MSKLTKAISLSSSVALLLILQGCKTGYNRTPVPVEDDTTTPPTCATDTANSSIDLINAFGVFELLADLTCDEASEDGHIMGQNTGFGNQIAIENNERSYSKLITSFKTDYLQSPAIVSIDYEHDKIFTAEELIEANDVLAQHWREGGLVSISWMPLNPWENDATGTRGSSADLAYPENDDTTNDTTNDEDEESEEDEAIDLSDLLDSSTAVGKVWLRKLDAMAVALKELQDHTNAEGQEDPITVLWRPLPSMNIEKYWWGLEASYDSGDAEDASLYTNIWKHMFRYFTEVKSLNNLLWVYSPEESSDVAGSDVKWAYPGEDYVDVVAGIARNNLLKVNDYARLKGLNKPLGMAEYSPAPLNNQGNFDNRTYGYTLTENYTFISYWVSWHPYDINEDAKAKPALNNNEHSLDLVGMNKIFTLEDNVRDQ